MRVEVNGAARGVAEGTSLVELVRELGHDPQQAGIAAAVNGEVVSRRAWAEHLLHDGDRVELVGASQGG